MHHWIIDVVTSKLLLKEATWWCSMVQKEYRSVGTSMSSRLDGYMCVRKMLVNVHCSPSPQDQYCWMHCHEFQDSRFRRWWLAPHAICNSSQAAKQRCSADERKILVVVTWMHTVKATRYFVPQFHNIGSYSDCMFSGRNSGFEGRGACMSIIQLWLEVCWIPNSWSEIPFKVIWFLGTRTDEKLAMIGSPLQGNEAFGVRFEIIQHMLHLLDIHNIS